MIFKLVNIIKGQKLYSKETFWKRIWHSGCFFNREECSHELILIASLRWKRWEKGIWKLLIFPEIIEVKISFKTIPKCQPHHYFTTTKKVVLKIIQRNVWTDFLNSKETIKSFRFANKRLSDNKRQQNETKVEIWNKIYVRKRKLSRKLLARDVARNSIVNFDSCYITNSSKITQNKWDFYFTFAIEGPEIKSSLTDLCV